MKYSKEVMEAVRQNLNLEPDDTVKDIRIESMSPEEVWERYLIWEGLIGYARALSRVHDNIFKNEKGNIDAKQ